MKQTSINKMNIVGLFNQVASAYDTKGPQFFSYFGTKLVNFSQVSKSSKLLDVATGRGAILYPAIRKVGSAGYVVGIDLSAEMVRETYTELEILGINNAAIHQMDAEELIFPDNSFDIVICGFSLFFFPQYTKALKEFIRVLKPGGRVAISTFNKNCDYFEWIRKVYSSVESFSALRARELLTYPVPAFGLRDGLEAILKVAGFSMVETQEEEASFIYKDEYELWASLWSYGTRQIFEGMSKEDIDAFKIRLFNMANELKGEHGISIPTINVLFACGTK